MTPYSTATVPPAGGAWKVSIEDFEVEELPAYLPSGEGEHLYAWIEKRGMTTPEAASAMAAAWSVPEQAFSWAGLKDKFSISRQWICFLGKAGAKAAVGDVAPGLKVLALQAHRNKLRNGHTNGNRFRVVLRGVKDVGAARASFEQLSARGLPNYFGEQRFGRAGNNAAEGKAVLLGQKRVQRFQRKLFLSALQSDLFNQLLAARVSDGTWQTVVAGDVLKKHATGGEFVCEDVETDGPRAAAFELSAAGPMFGPDMTEAKQVALEQETGVLQRAGLTLADFEKGGRDTQGTRRWYRVQLSTPELEVDGDAVVLRFGLPSGCYASGVVSEVTKSSLAGATGDP